MLEVIKNYLRMIKVENSFFSLPFAIAAMALAAKGSPGIGGLMLVILCVVFIRSGVAGFNRWYWADIDAKNPRTAGRAIPSGVISREATFVLSIASFVFFILCAGMLNKLSFILSPIPVILFMLYTFTRRLFRLPHLIMGIAASIAPMGGWIAATGSADIRIVALTIGVAAWYVAFDIYYFVQDAEFDREERVESIPTQMGIVFSLALGTGLTILAYFLFFVHGVIFGLRIYYFLGLVIAAVILFWGHYNLNRYGLEKLNRYFFNMRGAVGTVLCVSMIIDIAVYGLR